MLIVYGREKFHHFVVLCVYLGDIIGGALEATVHCMVCMVYTGNKKESQVLLRNEPLYGNIYLRSNDCLLNNEGGIVFD